MKRFIFFYLMRKNAMVNKLNSRSRRCFEITISDYVEFKENRWQMNLNLCEAKF